MPGGLQAGREALRLCNSYNRLPTLLDLWTNGTVEAAEDWLSLLGEEWSVCDNIGQFANLMLWESPLADVFNGTLDRRPLMTAEEARAFDDLPEDVDLFRGCYEGNKWGLCWSLDRAVAARFPTLHRYRQDGQPLLVKARARKVDIAAVKLCRNEAEVIAHRPRHVSTSKLPARPIGQPQNSPF